MSAKTKSLHSLKWQLFIRVAALMLVLIPLFGFVRNEMAQREAEEEFNARIEGAAQVLAVSLREPLWDLDETQIEESVRSLSMIKDLLAVRIVETGPSQYERLFTRDANGQLAQLSVTTAAQIDASVRFPLVVSWKDSDLATGELYFTDVMLVARQREQLLFLFGQLALFGVLVLGMLYYLVQHNVGEPLHRLREAMSESDSGALANVIHALPQNELRLLADRYGHVLTDLREHQQHLTEMVLSRTRALSESNEQLESEVQRRAKIEQELIQAREVAEQASEAKTFFLAHMSHELRTPLNGIIGYTQLLQQSRAIGKEEADYINSIHTCANHLLELINRVLDLSKIEHGGMERVDQPFDLPRLLQDVIAVVRPRCDGKGVALLADWSSTLPQSVLGDAAKLKQILINLLGNAAKFTDQGSVSLKVKALSEDQIEFIVEDTGVGIPARDIERIFEPFQQAGGAAQQLKEGGTGLGLSIARRFVELFGGQLALTSTVGVGSRFHFVLILPVAAEIARSGDNRSPSGIRGDWRPQLLIVDDVEHNRDILARMLRQLGFYVDTVNGGEESLAAIKLKRPDLVFMDIRMPGMDGITAARQIRESDAELPILAFTASVFDPHLDADIRRWFNGLALKPINLADICQQLSKLLHIEFDFVESHQAVDTQRDGHAKAKAQLKGLNEVDLTQLRNWLASGSITRIRDYAAQLKGQSGFGELAEQLQVLARTYDIEGLRRLING